MILFMPLVSKVLCMYIANVLAPGSFGTNSIRNAPSSFPLDVILTGEFAAGPCISTAKSDA